MAHPLGARRMSAPASVTLLVALTATGIYWVALIARPSVLFAFAFNWALMGFAYLAWLVWPLRFANGYSKTRQFECSGRLYEAVRVRLFQRILRGSGFHGARIFPRYVRGPDAARVLVTATVPSETAHCLILVVVNAVAVEVGFRRGFWDTAAWLLLFNVLLNAYPVLSLRYVRLRAERVFGLPGFAD